MQKEWMEATQTQRKWRALKAQTYQFNIKELEATRADCGVTSHSLHLGQSVALEHIAKPTVKSQFEGTLYAFVTGNKSSNQQVAVVCLWHLKLGKTKSLDI